MVAESIMFIVGLVMRTLEKMWYERYMYKELR